MKILLLDNYDSFTWNLVHYLRIAGAEVELWRNDELEPSAMDFKYHGMVVSPGPCTPLEAGNLMPVLNTAAGKMPILGICLGHQAIGLHFGCALKTARVPVHGKPRNIEHGGMGVFNGLPNPMQVGRYHSLVLDDIPANGPLQVTALCDGEVMAVQHRELPITGVQFHPESILTPQGQQLINNWIGLLV